MKKYIIFSVLFVSIFARAQMAGYSEPAQSLLSEQKQITFVGSRSGEGYFSKDGKKMIYQSERDAGNPFYQMLVKISYLLRNQQVMTAVAIIAASVGFGSIVNQLHAWYPSVFPVEAAFPYADSLVMMMSIAGNILLMVKKIESWILWVLVDILAPILYFQKGIYFVTIEYIIFLALATFALWNWLNIYEKQKSSEKT